MNALTPEQLAVLRVRVGLADDDTSKDTQIQAAMDAAMSLAEEYCDRKFEYKEGYVEEFCLNSDYSVSLDRYPLKEITSITVMDGSSVTPDYYVKDKKTGLLYIPGYAGDADLKVTYSGGHETLPADVWMALLMIFDNTFKELSSTSGSGASATISGDVKAISVPDVGRIEFESSSWGSDTMATSPWGLIPSNATSILWWHRREFC